MLHIKTWDPLPEHGPGPSRSQVMGIPWEFHASPDLASPDLGHVSSGVQVGSRRAGAMASGVCIFLKKLRRPLAANGFSH